MTAEAAQGAANPKAAFVRAKSKVLQKLSTQHLISHTLPVVISLKHTLEATKSSLQVTLQVVLFVFVCLWFNCWIFSSVGRVL